MPRQSALVQRFASTSAVLSCCLLDPWRAARVQAPLPRRGRRVLLYGLGSRGSSTAAAATSSAQFWANVLYAAPCLLDGYRHLIHEIAVSSEPASFTANGFVGFEATCFILLFPVNVWLYEARSATRLAFGTTGGSQRLRRRLLGHCRVDPSRALVALGRVLLAAASAEGVLRRGSCGAHDGCVVDLLCAVALASQLQCM